MPASLVSRIPAEPGRTAARSAAGLFSQTTARLFGLLLFALDSVRRPSAVQAAGAGAPSRAAGDTSSRHGIGTVAAWGDNTDGQTNIPAGLSGVAIAGGGFHSLALKSDGTVAAWGYNGYGQTTVPAGLSGVTAIAAGDCHSLALKSDGTVVAWGNDGQGQIMSRRGCRASSPSPRGYFHSLALKSPTAPSSPGAITATVRRTSPPGCRGSTALCRRRLPQPGPQKRRQPGRRFGYNNDGETTVPASASGAVGDRRRLRPQPCLEKRRHSRRLGR